MNEQEKDNLLGFLDALNKISRTYKIGITGDAALFILEDEDSDRKYTCDADSNLAYD